MCTYNRAQFIEKAIDSIISQTFKDWELIILDDKSTDNTENIVKKYLQDPRIKYFKNEQNLGITKNRNKSLSLSQGEYIAVLDSDDYWIDNNKLKVQIDFLDENKDYCFIGTNIIKIDENDKLIKKISYPSDYLKLKKKLLLKNFFCHSSIVYRKKEIIDSGSYDEKLPIWEDYDLWLRLGSMYKFKNLNMFSTAYRIHNNQSNQNLKIGQNTQKIIINRHIMNYSFGHIAKIINILRNIKQNLKKYVRR